MKVTAEGVQIASSPVESHGKGSAEAARGFVETLREGLDDVSPQGHDGAAGEIVRRGTGPIETTPQGRAQTGLDLPKLAPQGQAIGKETF